MTDLHTLPWIDTHAHLDAAELDAYRAKTAIKNRANAASSARCVIPAVEVSNFDTVRALAHERDHAYALGIHPLYVDGAHDDDLAVLDAALTRNAGDPRLVAVGEIGLDFFVPELNEEPLRSRQIHFYRAQLKLAKQHGLPVILHVRRSVDAVLKGLRDVGVTSGIAHAFNGSRQQADAFTALGFKLGFGGAMTHERALQLRRLASELPLSSIVLETDAPDIAPHWLYVNAERRAAGEAQPPNTPDELPRIGAVLADLRGVDVATVAHATANNARAALPKLAALWPLA